MDTTPLKTFASYNPEDYRPVRMIIGIEDDQIGSDFHYKTGDQLQICQWAFAAVPRHPLMERIIANVASNLEESIKANKTDYSGQDILDLTGPTVFSNNISAYLKEKLGIDEKIFHRLEKPFLAGDILIHPVVTFSPGAGNPNANPTFGSSSDPRGLLEHRFHGSWKH